MCQREGEGTDTSRNQPPSLLPTFSPGCFPAAFPCRGPHCRAVLLMSLPCCPPHRHVSASPPARVRWRLQSAVSLMPPAETVFDGHSSSDLRALSTPHPRYPLTQQRCPSHGQVEKEERNLLPGGHVQGRVNAKRESALPVQLWPWMPGRSLGGRKSCNVPPTSPG